MDILISNSSDKPIYEQISSQIKSKIISGELKAGDALPSMRLLAKELHISVITTQRAYCDLERDGFIQSITGKGSFVAGSNTQLLKEHQLQLVQEHLEQAVSIAQSSAITCQELQEILRLLYEEK